MEQASVIGDLGFDILCGIPTSPQFVEFDILEARHEFGFEDVINSAAIFCHELKVTCMPRPELDTDSPQTIHCPRDGVRSGHGDSSH